MKKISKIWIGIGIIAVLAIATWMFSGGKRTRRWTFDTAKVELAKYQEQRYGYGKRRACDFSNGGYTSIRNHLKTVC